MKLKLFLLIILWQISITRSRSQNFEEYPDSLQENDNQRVQIDSLKSLIYSYDQECLKLEITYNGYESANNETWYYDSLAVLKAYHSTWFMEGTSGDEYYWFDDGKLSFVYIENANQEDERTVFTDKSNPSFYEHESSIYGRQKGIKDFIRENRDSIEQSDYSVTITYEEKKDFGFEFIETTQFVIDIQLYNLLFTN